MEISSLISYHYSQLLGSQINGWLFILASRHWFGGNTHNINKESKRWMSLTSIFVLQQRKGNLSSVECTVQYTVPYIQQTKSIGRTVWIRDFGNNPLFKPLYYIYVYSTLPTVCYMYICFARIFLVCQKRCFVGPLKYHKSSTAFISLKVFNEWTWFDIFIYQ